MAGFGSMRRRSGAYSVFDVPATGAKMLAVDIRRGQHLADCLRVGGLMLLIKAFKDEFRRLPRHGKTLRDWRALRKNADKLRVGPHGREIDAAIEEPIGIDKPGHGAKRQLHAIDRMGGKQ